MGQKALAFVGLERIGGLMTYDVTNPEQPEFVNYINTREFTPKNNLETDTGPEGIEFIAAADSPTGLPLVLVANEVGGTVAIYQLNVTKVTLDKTALSLQAGSTPAVLTAAVLPAGEGAEGLSWSSSNTAVASVDQAGKVTPLTAGTAVISVYSADGYGLAEAQVTVQAADPVISQPGSSPSGGSTTGVTTPATAVSTSNGKTVLEVKATVDTAGNSSYPVSAADVTAAVEALKTSAADELVFRTAAGDAAGAATLTIPAAAWTEIAGSTAQTVTFTSGTGSVSLDRAAVSAIRTAAAGEAVSLTIAAANLTTGSSLIGSRPVVSLEVKTGSRNVSSFGTGGAVVSVPYTLAAGEDAAAVVAYYVSPAGGLTVLPASSYNAETGQLTFGTSHFSVYAVGYNKPAFTDTASSYAQDSITYLAARGIISGISAEQFGLKAS